MRLNDSELKSVAGGISIWAVLGTIAGLIFWIRSNRWLYKTS